MWWIVLGVLAVWFVIAALAGWWIGRAVHHADFEESVGALYIDQRSRDSQHVA